MRLKDKVAVVTGAGSSVGFAIAQRFAAEGAKVVIADVARAEEAAEKLKALGHTAIGLTVDVSSEEAVSDMAKQTIGAFGKIDILVNNAAISSANRETRLEELTVERWKQMLEVNVIGVFLCCRAVVPHMRERRYGRIINFSSTTTQRGISQMLHYIASKGAVVAMTRSLAREVGSDLITVNTIAPGYTLSEGNLTNNPEMAKTAAPFVRASRSIPRDAYPEDLVGGVVFLASDDAAFITGQTMNIDGGGMFL